MSDTFMVVLKMPLFTPIGYFPKTEDARNPSVLPEEVRKYLPKSAKIVEGAVAPSEARFTGDPEPETLSAVSKGSKGKGLKNIFAERDGGSAEN